MGEHYTCSQQPRTQRDTGIDGARPDPTASRSLRDDYRSGPLIALHSETPQLHLQAERRLHQSYSNDHPFRAHDDDANPDNVGAYVGAACARANANVVH
jgi:hypothetical protein